MGWCWKHPLLSWKSQTLLKEQWPAKSWQPVQNIELLHCMSPPGLPSNSVLQWLFPARLLYQMQVARPDTDLLSAVVTLIGQFLTGPWLPNRLENTCEYFYVHMKIKAAHCKNTTGSLVVWKSCMTELFLDTSFLWFFTGWKGPLSFYCQLYFILVSL